MAKLLKKTINFAPMNIKKRKAMAFKNGSGEVSPLYIKEVWRKTVETMEGALSISFHSFQDIFFPPFFHIFKTGINLTIAVGHSYHCLSKPIKTQQRDFPGGPVARTTCFQCMGCRFNP